MSKIMSNRREIRDVRVELANNIFKVQVITAVPFFQATTTQGQIQAAAGRRSRIMLPGVPFTAEYLEKSRMIFHAHQILFGPLIEYFKGKSDAISPTNGAVSATEDLNNVLNQFKNNYPQYFNMNTTPRNFRDRFYQIYHQRNEVCHQSYSIECFNLDKEVLIDVARYLAGQTTVTNRDFLVQSITSALNYSGTSTSRNSGINCSRYSADSTASSRRITPRPNSSLISRQQSQMG